MSQKILYLKLNSKKIEEKVKNLKIQNNFKLEDRQNVSGELAFLISKLE